MAEGNNLLPVVVAWVDKGGILETISDGGVEVVAYDFQNLAAGDVAPVPGPAVLRVLEKFGGSLLRDLEDYWPKYECANCGHQFWDKSALREIRDLHQRVAPGEPMPAGECPHCFCLVNQLPEIDLSPAVETEVSLVSAPGSVQEDLVAALKLALAALNTASRFKVPSQEQKFDDSYKIASELERVLKSATAAPGFAQASADGEILPGAYIEEIGSVMMQDIVGDYDVPEEVPEWTWVEKHASYGHVRNGQGGGVWEFILNISLFLPDVPEKLASVIAEARQKHLSYLVFHQGT